MIASRRSFLGGILTLAAAAAVVRPTDLLANTPWIKGDGIHDDAAGLQALIDGQPYRCDLPNVGWVSKDDLLRICGGNFRLSKGIVIRNRPAHIFDCTFDAQGADGDVQSVLTFEGARHTVVQNIFVRGNLNVPA